MPSTRLAQRQTPCWRRLTVADDVAPSRRANKVADWIEVAALARGSSIGSDALHELGASVGYRTADIDVGLTTMSRRSSSMGKAYPFRVANGAAALPDATNRVWTALLLMSSGSPLRRQLSMLEVSILLELVTAEALKSLYGPGTSAMRFGWPSEVGRPQDFPAAIRWLAEQMKVRVGSAYRPPYAKDGGVDVVAWRPFPDGRSGFPVLLAQCTLERDFVHKAGDVDVRVWSGWLALDVDPSTALALPEVVAAGEDWNALAARTVVLDRIRLSSLLAGEEHNFPSLDVLIKWTAEQVEQLKEMA